MPLNKCCFIGNTGNNPDIKTGDFGQVANLSLAISESYKNKAGEKVTTTEWIKLVFWGKIVDIVEKYVKKGQQIYVEGKMKTRSYEKDGVKHYTTEVYVNELVLLGSKNEGSQKSEQQAAAAQTVAPDSASGPDETNDLPFSFILPIIGIGLSAASYLSIIT
jgi:single-strand DNA-binding protein